MHASSERIEVSSSRKLTLPRVYRALLSIYLAYVLFLSKTTCFASVLFLLLASVGFCLTAVLCYRFLGWLAGCLPTLPTAARRSRRAKAAFFLSALAIALFILTVNWLACYPGSCSPDVFDQWQQTQTNIYDNWHPVFHTLLIKLFRMIYDSYPFALMAQTVLFSLALAYLVTTLSTGSWKTNVLLLLMEAFLCLSPIVQNVMTFLWKDNPMSAAALVFSAHAFQICQTRGEWLRKPLNVLAFSLGAACCCLLRFNGLMLVAPFLLILLIVYRHKLRLFLPPVLGVVLLYALVRFPLYGMLNVTYPDNLLSESVGLPMTILSDAYAVHPKDLDEEALSVFSNIAPQAEWAETYKYGEYNSSKWFYELEDPDQFRKAFAPRSDSEIALSIARMTLRTIRRNPVKALEVLNEATDLVWGLDGKSECYLLAVPVTYNNSIFTVTGSYDSFHTLGKQINAPLVQLRDLPLVRYFTQNIGVQLLVLAIAGLAALQRRGSDALLLCLPPLAYNFGTMLLLCGNDARFFQCTMCIMPLLAFALLRDRPAPKPIG